MEAVSVPSLELGPPPHPFSRKRVCSLPRNQRGGTHSPVGEGMWGPNSEDWRKSLVLCLLSARGEVFSFVPSAILLLIKACPNLPLSDRSNLVRPSVFEILHRVMVVFIGFREQLRVTEFFSDSQLFLETL